ncbi:MAG: hypothetical protein RR053_08225 [Evtepia sp.]
MYYYSTVNNVILTHSAVVEENGMDIVSVRFERPNDHGFDFAEGKIPHFIFFKTCGFSEDELFQLERYLRNNSALIWEFASKGGGENA